MAYSGNGQQREICRGSGLLILKRKEIYAQLLKNPDEVVKGTVKELAESMMWIS